VPYFFQISSDILTVSGSILKPGSAVIYKRVSRLTIIDADKEPRIGAISRSFGIESGGLADSSLDNDEDL
jgi:hypothetical protein